MSSRFCEAASSCNSDSKARVWMSRRWGISTPGSSLANEICFINSGMNHLQAQIAPPPSRANFSRIRAGATSELQLWYVRVKLDAYRRVEVDLVGGGSRVSA